MNDMSHEPRLAYGSIPALTKDEIAGAVERGDPAELHVVVVQGVCRRSP